MPDRSSIFLLLFAFLSGFFNAFLGGHHGFWAFFTRLIILIIDVLILIISNWIDLLRFIDVIFLLSYLIFVFCNFVIRSLFLFLHLSIDDGFWWRDWLGIVFLFLLPNFLDIILVLFLQHHHLIILRWHILALLLGDYDRACWWALTRA